MNSDVQENTNTDHSDGCWKNAGQFSNFFITV